MSDQGGWGQPPGGGYPPQPQQGWQQPQQQGWPQQQPQAQAPLGGPGIQISDVFDAFKVLLRRSMKGVLAVYLVLSIARIVGTVPSWVIQYLSLSRLSEGDFSGAAGLNIASICSSGLVLAIVVLIGTLTIGLYRAMRRQLVEGEGAVTTFGEAFGEAKTHLWMTMGGYLLYGVAIAVGAILCILPGLVAAVLFAFVPYLVAAVDGDIVGSFKRSIELLKKNVGPVLAIIAVMIAIVVVLAVAQLGVAALMTKLMGLAGTIVASAFMSLIGIVVGWVLFVLSGALFIACETADAGVPLQK